MHRQHITLLSVVSALIMGAAAGGVDDIVAEVRRDFKMGLFTRDTTFPQTGPGVNLNTFTGSVGVAPLAITQSDDEDHPFAINGQTVSHFSDAINSACNGQANLCSQQANGAQKGSINVGDCNTQESRLNTSSQRSSSSPRAVAQDRIPGSRRSPPSSPLSSTSTVDDGELSSPILPPLPPPRLPDRASELLRTPPHVNHHPEEDQRFVTASWGSPYPQAESHRIRRPSFSSSDNSGDSPLHQLEIDTRFLRPAPDVPDLEPLSAQLNSSLSGSAAVLVNRVRRPLGGITEDWIRQHTITDPSSEHRLWLSDGTDDSGHSSLSGSVTSDHPAWLEENDLRTPRAAPQAFEVPTSAQRRHPRNRSSIETLRQAAVYRAAARAEKMDPMGVEQSVVQDVEIQSAGTPEENGVRAETPLNLEKPTLNGSAHEAEPQEPQEPQLPALPSTPVKSIKSTISQTPRLKKKVPWKGKNIMVLLPRDDERGQPGMPPMPLDHASTEAMFRSWEELGYNIRGFDLDGAREPHALDNNSRSRGEWPAPEDMVNERSQGHYHVSLPDLNAWKDYVNDLAEAKLRALGVTFAEEEPAPQPSASPVPSNLSRPGSTQQFPGLPFSPPIPPSSATSNPGFPFAPFLQNGPAAQSPGIPGIASPVSFNGHPGKFNPRASISISPNELPFQFPGQPSPMGWSPQLNMLQQQQLGRSGSPSILNMISPGSPFSPDGMSHQRNQSLQYPMLPHQFLQRQDSARASPRLQEVLEDEEETQTNPYDNSPAKSPEPAPFVQHNASNSLQREIDDAEYHLEEQFRSQLEHEDYSPHNEIGPVGPMGIDTLADQIASAEAAHQRGPSVHFSGIGTDSDEGPKLHHPQPHSRGHSLSQNPFFETDEVRDSTDEGSIRKSQPDAALSQKADSSFEMETNPSNLGTPAQSFTFDNKMYERSLSIQSNPWADSESHPASKLHSRQGSHQSKPSLSKLNAGAAEFKFNPTSNFTPGQFVFGGSNPQAPAFTPSAFQASTFAPIVPQSATSSHFSVPSTGSSSMAKINPSAPVFSPHKSEFSFSASGPKFNPDAKAFQPLASFASSVNSAVGSGNESDARPDSIFGNIDLTSSQFVKPVKKSKAIPIVAPRRSPTPVAAPSPAEVPTITGESLEDLGAARNKKQFRDNDNNDGDDVPLFAEPTPEPESIPKPADAAAPAESLPEEAEAEAPKVAVNDQTHEEEVASLAVDDQAHEDESAAAADTTLASTVLSESTDDKLASETNDTKATTSPSATSPDPEKINWRPLEFKNDRDIYDFNDARPFGDKEPSFDEEVKPHLSATAKPFVPGNFTFGAADVVNTPFEPDFTTQPAQMADPVDDWDEDRAGSPTPGPDLQPAAEGSQGRRTVSPQPVAATGRGLRSSRFASPPPAPKGLKASRFAASPSPTKSILQEHAASPSPVSEEQLMSATTLQTENAADLHSYEPLPVSPPSDAGAQLSDAQTHELTFEEIDAVMQDMAHDPTVGVKRTVESPKWHQPSPIRKIPVAALDNSSPVRLPPQLPFRSDGPSPSPREYRLLPQEPVAARPSTELEDPFIDPPLSALSQSFDGPVQRLNAAEDLPESEWDDTFSASEQGKLEQRVQYFDGHVNDLVGNLLASRIDPLEKTLGSIQLVLDQLSRRAPSSRRERRSVSAEIQESDADDEDDEVPLRRSMSPRRDKKLDQIRIAVMDAMNQHQASRTLEPVFLEPTALKPAEDPEAQGDSAVVNALEEMKLHISENMPKFSGDDIHSIVADAVRNGLPPPPAPVVKDDEEANKKLAEMQSRINELEQRLRSEESRTETERWRVQELEEKLRVGESQVENEIATRRAAEDRTSELRRQLEQAETKVEVEIMNRSVFDQRTHDLEERLKNHEGKAEIELAGRREAEDRLSEIQRLLRISSEEEDRLRAVLEERDQKIKGMEQAAGKTSMRLTLLEAAQTNAEQTHSEMKNRMSIAEVELRDSRQEARHWRSEAEQARESASRQADDFVQAINETKHLHKLIDTLGVQLEENERIRDNWRAKFVSLQDDMAHAAREITEENSRRTKKEQALIARHEVLDARLQAEARTRERLEVEVERLESGERAGMRAVSECKRLDGLLAELRNDNHNLHQQALRAQREIQEAVESAATEKQRAQLEIQVAQEAAAAEVQRARQEVKEAKEYSIIEAQQIRESVVAELEASRDQTHIAAADFEEEITRLRAQVDQVKLEADTAKAHHDMMLEEAQSIKDTEIAAAQNAKAVELEEITRKHQNEIEDLQARYERKINNGAEDAQRTEQNLLERLSLSASKTEHLQDRVAHLEEKVQIAQEAAKAAAKAASQATKNVSMPEASAHPGPVGQTKQLAQAMQLPEKISPQALRESIMVLQEQLQAREQTIEELEQTISKLDPDAPTKISKRDDEITWLRELLAVRHGDLQDIIAALSADRYDREAVKDATIRLKANLQMEEQEHERAMNGGSALNLPNIAATISKAATPRVAQAVGPLAAAWGNWRRANQSASRGSGMASPAPGRNSTPSKSNSLRSSSQNSLLSGLMTPPASGVRNTPEAEPSQSQPTAFSTTGRRLTAEQFANRARGPSLTARQAEKMPLATTPPPRQEKEPRTPPMMQTTSYDADAQMEEFDDASFFDDE
ncbi:hypothetical protein F5Y16DRAFT_423854 [Xylariaceae sp. FL0255]|nr:hypothetical protein F5Y16DRAFT_423854 [Xylariaceae sp. FL0255]